MTYSYFCLIVGTIFIIDGNTELQSFEHPTKVDGSLSILVVGNWGRKGSYNQSHVAYQMGIIGVEMDLVFYYFYSFEDTFTKIFTAPSLQIQWYSANYTAPSLQIRSITLMTSNRFWGTITTRDGLAHLSPILKQRDTKWFCLKSYNLSTDITEFFFIDTTPFQGKYFTDPKDEVYDWRGMLPRENYLTILLKDLESTLRKSHAKWKIVIGHHTIRSGRIHGDSEVLVKRFLPILQ
ncbi:Hypothetical predicted protein, partial [Olea europaea subsp. europaea]